MRSFRLVRLMFEPGHIVRFNYLWAREARRGEETGRKARPACIVVRTATNPAALFLLPLTSQAPSPERATIAVPETECRRAQLRVPCWIIVDEYNRVLENAVHDFESLEPLGKFSVKFLKRVAEALKDEALTRRLKAVARN
jgi:hypothetical protein